MAQFGIDTAGGQLAAAASTLLDVASLARTVDVILRNTNTSSETVELKTSRDSGTTYQSLVKAVLGAGEGLAVTGLHLRQVDILQGLATDAAQVDYQCQPSNAGELDIFALTTAGALKTAVPSNAMGTKRLKLEDARNSDYTVLTASAGASKFGFSVTAGTSMALSSEASQNNTKTDTVLFEFIMPSDYQGNANLTLTVNIQRVVASGTTLTTTISANVYKVADDGTMGADLNTTSTITFTNTAAADKTFTITGTSLSPGDKILIKLVAVATEGGNAGTVLCQLNSIRLAA